MTDQPWEYRKSAPHENFSLYVILEEKNSMWLLSGYTVQGRTKHCILWGWEHCALATFFPGGFGSSEIVPGAILGWNRTNIAFLICAWSLHIQLDFAPTASQYERLCLGSVHATACNCLHLPSTTYVITYGSLNFSPAAATPAPAVSYLWAVFHHAKTYYKANGHGISKGT